MASLKVYGGLMHRKGRQVRTIVATTSWKRAAELVGTTVGQMKGFWSIAVNATELAIAMASPDVVFEASSSMGKDFKPRATTQAVSSDEDLPGAGPSM